MDAQTLETCLAKWHEIEDTLYKRCRLPWLSRAEIERLYNVRNLIENHAMHLVWVNLIKPIAADWIRANYINLKAEYFDTTEVHDFEFIQRIDEHLTGMGEYTRDAYADLCGIYEDELSEYLKAEYKQVCAQIEKHNFKLAI